MLKSYGLVVGGWVCGVGGLQDFSVSASPLLGLFGVGTGLDWVGTKGFGTRA